MGDYAGSEPFLVEGDSLLLKCLSDSKLDFDRKCCDLLWHMYKVRRESIQSSYNESDMLVNKPPGSYGEMADSVHRD